MINCNNLDIFNLDFDSDLNIEKTIAPQNSFEIAYKNCFNKELYVNEEPLDEDYSYQYIKTKESTKEKIEENLQNISEKEDKLLCKKRGRKKNIEKIINKKKNNKKINNDKKKNKKKKIIYKVIDKEKKNINKNKKIKLYLFDRNEINNNEKKYRKKKIF